MMNTKQMRETPNLLNRVFGKMTNTHMLIVIHIFYFWVLSDATAEIGVVVFMRNIAPNMPEVVQALFIIAFVWLTVEERSAVGLLISGLPQYIYFAASLQWYLTTDGLPVAGMANHLLVSIIILYLVYKQSLGQDNGTVSGTS